MSAKNWGLSILRPSTITYDIISKLIAYDPATGIFTRLDGPKSGKRAGHLHVTGYRKITLGHAHKCSLYEHRVAVLLMTGSWPAPGQQVDHIDGDKKNNRWENMRVVDRATNAWNCKVSVNNQSGRTGVCWSIRRKTWMAYITVRGKAYKWTGFRTFLEAVQMRELAELLYRGNVNWRQPKLLPLAA